MLNPTTKIKLLNKYAIGNFIYYFCCDQVAVQCRIFIMFLYKFSCFRAAIFVFNLKLFCLIYSTLQIKMKKYLHRIMFLHFLCITKQQQITL